MRLHQIFVTILLLATMALARPALAGDHCQKGDPRCEWYQKQQGFLPAIPDMVCIYYVQPLPDKVLLTIYLKNGGVVHLRPKNSQVADYQCIGRHWIHKSERINLCNGAGGTDYTGADLAFLATKPEYSHAETACLYGRERCKRMGYKTGPP